MLDEQQWPSLDACLFDSLRPINNRAYPAISHCSHLLLKCRVATNISHWLKVHSSEVKKIHICEKVYFDQLLDFPILLLSFLHTLLLCLILLFEYWIFQYHQGVKQFESRAGPTYCHAWSGSKLFAKVIHHIYINCWFPVYRWSVI